MSLYHHLFGKPCHLQVELEHSPFCAIKAFNFDIIQAGSSGRLQFNELDELCNEAYQNAKVYKAKTKMSHD